MNIWKIAKMVLVVLENPWWIGPHGNQFVIFKPKTLCQNVIFMTRKIQLL
jgi:hypothetical protein